MITAIRQVKHLKRKQKFQVIWAEDGCQRSNSTFDVEADAEAFRAELQVRMAGQSDSSVTVSDEAKGAKFYVDAAEATARAAMADDGLTLMQTAEILAKTSKIHLDHQDTTAIIAEQAEIKAQWKEIKQAAKHGQAVKTKGRTGGGPGTVVRRGEPVSGLRGSLPRSGPH